MSRQLDSSRYDPCEFELNALFKTVCWEVVYSLQFKYGESQVEIVSVNGALCEEEYWSIYVYFIA